MEESPQSEWNSDNGHGEQHRRNGVSSASHHPASTSQMVLPITPSGPGADIRLPGVDIARHGPEAERKERVGSDIERGPRQGVRPTMVMAMMTAAISGQMPSMRRQEGRPRECY